MIIKQIRWVGLLVSLVLAGSRLSFSQVPVWTQHNDNSRTGANLNETILNTSNVNGAQFGKVFVRSLDGHAYAQPLYMPNVTIPGQGVHNVVYAVSAHNSVYAFDADSPSAAAPLWQVNLGPSIPSTDYPDGYADPPEQGATPTPVIDTSTGTLYVTCPTRENGAYIQRLHALNIATGQEKFNGPVVVQATVPGVGAGSSNSIVTFDVYHCYSRPALLLSNGVIYLCFASHGDLDPFHGWVLGYNAATLQQVAVFNDTPNGTQGGIWQFGQGPAADASGNIYLMTGNGTYDANSLAPSNFGDCFLKLSPAGGGLSVADWFTPFNQAVLYAGDLDVGMTGVLLIPGTNLLVGGTKQGIMYVLNQNNMGRYNPTDDSQVVQKWQVVNTSNPEQLFGSPIYWNSPNNGPVIYVMGWSDNLKAYKLVNGLFQTTPAAQSLVTATGYPGGYLSLSANGSTPGTGIVWAWTSFQDPNTGIRNGILRAFDASNVATELWNSSQNGARDSAGVFSKFSYPTVANGKVYVATFSGQLVAYGLMTPSLPTAPTNVVAVPGDTQNTISWSPSPGATSYNLKASLTDGGPYKTIASNILVNNYITGGLTNGLPHYYVVSAVNSLGESPNSLQVAATPMAVPVGVTAAGGPSLVNLSWAPSAGASGYNVKRAAASGGPYTNVASGISSNSFTDPGLANGTTYYYVISAVNNTGESANSVEVSATPHLPWQAADLTVGTDNKTRLLWDHPNGAEVIWSLDSQFNPSYGAIYGPYSGWTARSISAGGDGLSRVLWNYTNGTAGLWLVNAGGSQTAGWSFGPYPGWTAADVAVSTDNKARVLWTASDGRISIWSVDNSGAPFYGPIYGPYAGYTAQRIAAGGDGLLRVLWNKNDGTAALWLIGQADPYNNQYEASFGYGPYPNWTAVDVAVGTDSQARILWTAVDGRMAVWSVDNSGAPSYGPVYGPYPGYRATAITTGGDGLTRILWKNANGATALWTMKADNTLAASSNGFGPY